MKTTKPFSLICWLTCLSVAVCQAGGSRRIRTKQLAQSQPLSGYAARAKYFGTDQAKTRVQIYSRKTGRVAWSGILTYVGEGKDFSWSADHTATAMIDRSNGQYRLLIWQAGKGMRVISRLHVPAEEEEAQHMSDVLSCDCVGSPVLSPDKRRVLILCSQSQGPASVGLYQLWCLTLRTRHLQFIYQHAYTWESYQRPRWVNSHKIAYTQQRVNEANEYKWEFVSVTKDL